jgi:LppP/LprE lipoprotein
MTSRTVLGAIAALCAGAAAGGLLGACGSQTHTVTAAGAPAGTAAATGSQAVTVTGASTSATAPAPANGATTAPATTRSAPEPAFTEGASATPGASAAAAVVRAQGYTPVDLREYHPNQTLQVLVATLTGSGDGYNQRAFFFLDGHYLGTDAKEPSAAVHVVSQSDTQVTLAYTLYRHNDPLCCPGGGAANVRFQLDNGRLVALDPIPPVGSASGPGRD